MDQKVTNATDERREGEGLTEFTMRRVRNSIIEECAKTAEGERLRDRTAPERLKMRPTTWRSATPPKLFAD
jgi:hypothetical protein